MSSASSSKLTTLLAKTPSSNDVALSIERSPMLQVGKLVMLLLVMPATNAHSEGSFSVVR